MADHVPAMQPVPVLLSKDNLAALEKGITNIAVLRLAKTVDGAYELYLAGEGVAEQLPDHADHPVVPLDG